MNTSKPFPDDLELVPVSRWPTTLNERTSQEVLNAPVERRVPPFMPDDPITPVVSIVMVTLDGLVFTRLCLESLLYETSSSDVEIIVVDNGSTDGTIAYLRELSARDARVRVELNARNTGFAAATNRGVGLASADLLILLNNDTIVPARALDALIDHLTDSHIGLVGAVTNRAGNEAEIDVPYRTVGELAKFAEDHMGAHKNQVFDIRAATMFCVGLRRDVWNKVGPLDERFEIGLFEDDDYAMRVRQTGHRVVCAEDVFVHHFGQASIGRLGPTGEYGRLFHANRERWEAKWNAAWQPYGRRARPAYQALVERVRRIVCDTVPPDATVLVLSKGDVELLKLENRQAWHFPQCDDGTYAGHHPANSEACIAELERVRAMGAEFLVIPAPAMWWLTHYDEFRRHLETRYQATIITSDCSMFGLKTPAVLEHVKGD